MPQGDWFGVGMAMKEWMRRIHARLDFDASTPKLVAKEAAHPQWECDDIKDGGGEDDGEDGEDDSGVEYDDTNGDDTEKEEEEEDFDGYPPGYLNRVVVQPRKPMTLTSRHDIRCRPLHRRPCSSSYNFIAG
ncbi:hypothetical protein HBI81_257060 [Parastagonospora nodorum]|nr:hypothetical protein HBI73_237740 [Parastagonospora nodorum]KAH5621113.1 hypothetical protein HBI23_241080 [Parastagonospora nodorum]KAH5707005.1 hypothetical protein HBI18_251320 [Parastagonospora nodorum]KAH6510755.1 hypothetical protein HBI81_257060 [Parastagonospora nodorum]